MVMILHFGFSKIWEIIPKLIGLKSRVRANLKFGAGKMNFGDQRRAADRLKK